MEGNILGRPDQQRRERSLFTFQLYPEQRRDLERIASERQLSLGDVVREAVRTYLAESKRQEEALAAA